ncbi:uncharacterized protein FIBRA_05799 [Fibroporia radiculosa]|uniref:Uncharacterized protein n=1 Tax=Fibroporia radiculosa TaxID=599839 RepID=J4GRM5_9APHY|nr:uncharacterized protein FIBRA_05799 [Fibroporia radiculosa]CCM03655.1 predicted protein [Fibroporia radiculosa]
MWIAHFSSGLVAKPFAPGIPLSVLCLAGAAADAAFFLLQFINLESFNLDTSIAANRGCFPYANDYPYSHSLAGMGAVGFVVALGYKALRPTARASLSDMIVIVLASLSHFLLEWPSHRAGETPPLPPPSSVAASSPSARIADIKLTPYDDRAIGAGLFDHPMLTFLAEAAIFLTGLWVYATFAPKVTRTGYLTNRNRLPKIVAFMLVQQAHFCFGAAPTYETRWVHAPLFLSEVLGSCWVLGKLEG